MKILGVTGGVGSGKSLVLSYLRNQAGIAVYEADAIARELQVKGGACLQAMVSYFGNGILDENQNLDRKKLGGIVFGDEHALHRLNQIVHPLVGAEINRLIAYHKENGTKIFVLEAAILLEANYQEFCNEVWYIYCKEEVRLERLRKSRDYSDALFRDIVARQKSEEEFKQKCQCIIDNNAEEEHLYSNIDVELERLLGEKETYEIV